MTETPIYGVSNVFGILIAPRSLIPSAAVAGKQIILQCTIEHNSQPFPDKMQMNYQSPFW